MKKLYFLFIVILITGMLFGFFIKEYTATEDISGTTYTVTITKAGLRDYDIEVVNTFTLKTVMINITVNQVHKLFDDDPLDDDFGLKESDLEQILAEVLNERVAYYINWKHSK